MINKINFNILFKPLMIISAAVALSGIIMLLIFGGNTFAEYTVNNLRTSLVVKIIVFSVLLVLFATAYLFLRFKKKGLWLGLFAGIGAAVNSVTAFCVCIVFRASLGDIALALAVFAALVTYLTALVFANKLSAVVIKKNTNKEELYLDIARNTLATLIIPIILFVIVVLVGFVVSLIFSAYILSLYALPVIFTLVYSVIFTITFTCNLYFRKI